MKFSAALEDPIPKVQNARVSGKMRQRRLRIVIVRIVVEIRRKTFYQLTLSVMTGGTQVCRRAGSKTDVRRGFLTRSSIRGGGNANGEDQNRVPDDPPPVFDDESHSDLVSKGRRIRFAVKDNSDLAL